MLAKSRNADEYKPLLPGEYAHGGYAALARDGALAAPPVAAGDVVLFSEAVAHGRGLHSPTFQLNLSRCGHTSPCPPVSYTGGKSCTQRIPQNVLTLSRNVDECKPLAQGTLEWTAQHERRVVMLKYCPGHVGWGQEYLSARTPVGRCRLTLSNPR